MAKQIEESQEKAYHSARLQRALELEGSPVAVAILPEPPELLRQWQHKATPCMMLQSARRGSAFYCSGECIFCGGGAHLGIARSPVRNLGDFLVRGEKLFGSKEAAGKMLHLVKQRTPKLGRYLAFSPLEKASFSPDVILFVGTPLQVGRIIFLDAFETGEIDTVHGEPLCSGVIATPITTRKIGVSFLDMTCRLFGKYKPEEMVVGVPSERLPRIVNSIDRSIAGVAKPRILRRWWGETLYSG
jgi:uncharacterized protein (DUF169 family)